MRFSFTAFGDYRAAIAAACVLAASPAARAAVEYGAVNLRSITTVSGFAVSQAEGISLDGNFITGRGLQSYTTGTGATATYTTAYRYQANTGELIRLPEISPGSNASPNNGAGVNNSGLVAGGGTLATGGGRGFLASQTAVITIPRPQESGPAGSTARAINNLGQVAGDQVNNPGSQPFVYADKNGNVAYDAGESTVLPFLGGDSLGVVGGINNAGQVTGYTANSASGGASNTRHVTLWSPDGNGGYAVQNITDGTNGAPGNGQGVALNDSAAVAYYNSATGSAYLYRDPDAAGPAAAASVSIPNLYGLVNNFPTDVNNANVVVGASAGSVSGTNVRYAYIWDEINGVRDLNTLLPADFNYVLTTATGISDTGVISATGTIKGGTATAGFLIVPVPEPAVLAPLACGGAFLLRGRRGRR